MSLRRALLCTVGLVGSSALPTGEHHSFGSMIALLATQDDQQQVATEPGTHLGQVTSIMAKSTVDLATAVAEAIPGYWLAFAMVVVVVVIFMLCWCVLALRIPHASSLQNAGPGVPCCCRPVLAVYSFFFSRPLPHAVAGDLCTAAA